MLFFHLRKSDLETLEDATLAAQTQFEDMTRLQLDRSFHQVLDMMKRLPATLSWRDCAATAKEIAIMREQIMADLVGGGAK